MTDLALTNFLIRTGDDCLIVGHRLSEWCGHAPILEEDVALANIALDCIGTANALYTRACDLGGGRRTPDELAFLRSVTEFRNALIVELPRGDFARTIVRQYLFAEYELLLFEALSSCPDPEVAGIAGRTINERKYHVRHCREWVARLGLGTEESRSRAQAAVDELWPYTAELFQKDKLLEELVASGVLPGLDGTSAEWTDVVSRSLSDASLVVPADVFQHVGGREGRHTEHLGHLLDEMQIVARSHPDGKW
ncbi:MAG: phenylacetate-CoA oxygenase subunit PaaC [Bacteroidetes bacterium]|nr:phenylacetate-CoA oxygenase subunit PaaC [Bacteroidota bacterium]